MRSRTRYRFRPFWAPLVVWATVVTLARPSVSGESDSIVLVHEAGQELVTVRIRDELYALGWLVVEIPESGAGEPLSALAERVHAFSGVKVAHGELELWIAPVRGAAFHERIGVDATDPEVTALRAVEVLRTRFLQLGLTPPAEASHASDGSNTLPDSQSSHSTPAPAPEPLAHPPASPDREKPRSRRTRSAPPMKPAIWLGIGAGAAASAGGLGAYPALAAEFRIPGPGRWSFGGDALTPLVAPTVASSHGSAVVRPSLLQARTDYSLLGDASMIDVALSAALGAALVQMDGKAERPYGGRSDAVVALAFSAGSALSLRLSPRWSVRAEVAAGIASPRPAVRFAGDTVATWGRPFGVATLGVEVGIGR